MKLSGCSVLATCLLGLASCGSSVTIINESGKEVTTTMVRVKSNSMIEVTRSIPINCLERVTLPSPQLDGGYYFQIFSLLKDGARCETKENIKIKSNSIISIREKQIFVYEQ